MWGDSADERFLLSREDGSSPPVEAHECPNATPRPEHRAQLVLEPQRLKDVAVAMATPKVAIGRPSQRSHSGPFTGQLRPLVHVVAQELVLDEVGACRDRELLAVALGKEQSGGIHGGPPDSVHRNRPA